MTIGNACVVDKAKTHRKPQVKKLRDTHGTATTDYRALNQRHVFAIERAIITFHRRRKPFRHGRGAHRRGVRCDCSKGSGLYSNSKPAQCEQKNERSSDSRQPSRECVGGLYSQIRSRGWRNGHSFWHVHFGCHRWVNILCSTRETQNRVGVCRVYCASLRMCQQVGVQMCGHIPAAFPLRILQMAQIAE